MIKQVEKSVKILGIHIICNLHEHYSRSPRSSTNLIFRKKKKMYVYCI